MRILRLNKQDTAGIEERQAAERPPPLSGEAGPERAGCCAALVLCARTPVPLHTYPYGYRIEGVFQDIYG